ncbi:uncharacterized protein LOC129585093 [Paramacrobiotus metropolitanus]|uniref:uncharacterized protein LOC129585093 n=1 Tax=Paramacrobiotus metropolitanus TaxID=2943436 RepID=UPI002445C9EA|nr:uncharacterized protein LOC129585093 [Paramacrobiotus metropolitanus]
MDNRAMKLQTPESMDLSSKEMDTVDKLKKQTKVIQQECDVKERDIRERRGALLKINDEVDKLSVENISLERENRKKDDLIRNMESEVDAVNVSVKSLEKKLSEAKASSNFLADIFGDRANDVRALLDECDWDTDRLDALLMESSTLLGNSQSMEKTKERYFKKLANEYHGLAREKDSLHARRHELARKLISAQRDSDLGNGITRFDRRSAWEHRISQLKD